MTQELSGELSLQLGAEGGEVGTARLMSIINILQHFTGILWGSH